MHVLGLQFDIAWEDKPANHDKIHRLLSSARPLPGALIVLPEMFATGFSMDIKAVTDDDGTTQRFLADIAKEYQVNVLAGLVRERRNEALLFDAEGREVARYAKMHPFKLAGESVEPGTETVVVDCAEFKLSPTVCYDLRFPELFRAGLKRGTNLFAVIANWPTPRLDHWLTLLKARAIENQSYVIGVNRCGRDPGNEYPGRSQIISPRGEVLVDAGDGETVMEAGLDLSVVQTYRERFPVLQDANQHVSEPSPFPIAEFETQLAGLIDQLFTANVHFQIATGLRKSWREYYPEAIQAHVFWRYTIHAHETMAILGLCRVYDNTRTADRRCLTLRRLITTVEVNRGVFQESEFRKRLKENPHVDSLARHFAKLDEQKLGEDMAFCDGDIVKRLIELRHKLVAHLNYEYAIGKERDFFEKDPLPISDIQTLIDRGFETVNRYLGNFITTTHSDRLASQQDQDYLIVLKALRKLRPPDK